MNFGYMGMDLGYLGLGLWDLGSGVRDLGQDIGHLGPSLGRRLETGNGGLLGNFLLQYGRLSRLFILHFISLFLTAFVASILCKCCPVDNISVSSL